MQALYEGEKRVIEVQLKRRRGSGAISLTSPERRILDANRDVASGFDWASATWNSTDEIISTLFDSTQAALQTPGVYYLQFRGVIGADRPEFEVQVVVREWGP